MGYYMDQRDCVFEMPKANADKALAAIKELFSKPNYRAGWVDTPSVLRAETFEDAISEARFDVEGNGTCYDWISFNGEKRSWCEEDVLNAIAPFVEEGSYIEMQGEDGDRWHWIFHKGGVEEKYARLVWD